MLPRWGSSFLKTSTFAMTILSFQIFLLQILLVKLLCEFWAAKTKALERMDVARG